jgi:hypothetical protein
LNDNMEETLTDSASKSPNPGLIYDLDTGIFRPQVIRLALQVDVFTPLADGPADAATVASACGYGLFGTATAASGTTNGVYGQSLSTSGRGVYGRAESPNGIGVYGEANTGVEGSSGSSDGVGVRGIRTATSGPGVGVLGVTYSPTGYAGYFEGAVHIAGTLSKSAGAFKIDHPLDPANQYLSHSFVESPDMKNIYDGMAVLDASGAAVVTLPAWFEALNRDFRYQLTPIGAAMPNLHVVQEIEGNAFRIAGGKPGLKASWQVTGIRHDPDPYAEQNRIVVEEPNPTAEQGTYLYPQGYGQPESLGRDYQRNSAPQ